MGDHEVVLTVAAYASEAAAEQDFDAVGRARDSGPHHHVAAAVLMKGADGALTIHRSDGLAANVAWGGALLGAALAVIAAPVGILFLQPVATTSTEWARVAALVDHFWRNVPQETLHRMSNMLESSPAGLVIVAVDQTTEDIGVLPSEATATTVIAPRQISAPTSRARSTMRTPPAESGSGRHPAPRCPAGRSDKPTQLRRSPDPKHLRFAPWRRRTGEVALISSLWVRAWRQQWAAAQSPTEPTRPAWSLSSPEPPSSSFMFPKKHDDQTLLASYHDADTTAAGART